MKSIQELCYHPKCFPSFPFSSSFFLVTGPLLIAGMCYTIYYANRSGKTCAIIKEEIKLVQQ